MLRLLYLWLLRLHPAGFRERFTEEMLCIFDQTVASQAGKKRRAASRLLADGVLSLVRQWTRVAGHQEEVNAFAGDTATADALPVFYSLPSFKPSPGAMIYGAALSVAAFCVVFFAMRYSWTHRAAIVLPVESYAADSSASSSDSLTLPSVGAAEDQAETPPPARFALGHTVLPSTPETVTSAATTEAGIKATSIRAGIAPQFHRKTAVRVTEFTRQGGENTLDKSGTAADALTNPSPSGYQGQVVSAPTSEWLEAYVGTYVADTPAHLQITVSTRDGQLEIEFDGQDKTAAVAISKTKFLLAEKTNDRIEFVESSDGAVRELNLYRDGQRIRAHRR
jgi:hypothetical protein